MLTIYGLYDQNFPEVFRYIGRTYSKANRTTSHFSIRKSNDWDAFTWTPLSLWKRAMRLAGRKVGMRDIIVFEDVAQPPRANMIPSKVHTIEKNAIARESIKGPLLNNEFVLIARQARGLSSASYSEYRRAVLRVVSGEIDAIKIVQNYEQSFPDVCCILHPGNLYDGIRKAQEQSGCITRQTSPRLVDA